MHYTHLTMVCLLLLTACKKDKPQKPELPIMQYTTLSNAEIMYGKPPVILDFNKDGVKDMLLGVELIGDPIEQMDKRWFRVVTPYTTLLPVTEKEEIPVHNVGDIIQVTDYPHAFWYGASAIVLVERREHVSGTIGWYGNWLHKKHRYLPFQVVKESKRWCGWLELSTHPEEGKIILHQFAICTVANTPIIAGK